PLPKALWPQRNNNNYQQTGLLTSLHYFAANKQLFLRNFYTKSKRSILKARTEGPAAYVFTADDPRPGAQADLLRTLQKQGVEISRATAPFTVTVPGKKAAPKPTTTNNSGQEGRDRQESVGGPNGQDGREGREEIQPRLVHHQECRRRGRTEDGSRAWAPGRGDEHGT